MHEDANPNIEPFRARRVAAASEPSRPREHEYPVREYIGAMCHEMAQMARWDGDETLATLLEVAGTRAQAAAAG